MLRVIPNEGRFHAPAHVLLLILGSPAPAKSPAFEVIRPFTDLNWHDTLRRAGESW
jgi:hypothetical protein